MKPKKKPTSLFLLCFCPAVLDSGDGDSPKCKPILRRKLSHSKKTEHDRSSDDGSTYSKRTDDSMTSSPSSSFRKGSPTPPPPQEQVKMPKQGRFNYGSATVFCLLVASLSVMLFYGRVCAILWTCTWFYSLPCRRRGCGVSCLIGGGGPADGAKEQTTRGRRRAAEGEETKRNRKF